MFAKTLGDTIVTTTTAGGGGRGAAAAATSDSDDHGIPLCRCAPFHIELLCWCIMCLAIWSRERLSIVSRYQYNRLKRFV